MKQLKMLLLTGMVTICTTFTQAAPVNMAPIISYLLSDTVTPTVTPPSTVNPEIQIAVDKIQAYVDNQANPVPTASDYAYIGIIDMTVIEVMNMNSAVVYLTRGDVITQEMILAIAVDLGFLPPPEPIENIDTLVITKQSNSVFTINWDKNYTVIAGFGYSSIAYVEYNKDPDSLDQAIQVIASHVFISEHQITCSKYMDEDYQGNVVFQCVDIITYPELNTLEITSYFRIKPNLTYYIGLRYDENPLEFYKWQGADYEISYTSDGTLTIE